jgi:imidazole glycerol phosphate synthase glutamine amidotransferase subunit
VNADRRVAVIDYGLANIRSVVNALDCFEVDVKVMETGSGIVDAGRIVLPGVGSFDAGMRGLAERGHVEALRRRVLEGGVPYLGICLGLQFLFEGSAEGSGSAAGLGWLTGKIERFPSGQDRPKVPHVGWNEVEISPASALMAGLQSPTDFYFVHSYYAPLAATQGMATGVCDYGVRFCAALERDNIAAVQFHPEKSQLGGMKLIETFLAKRA